MSGAVPGGKTLRVPPTKSRSGVQGAEPPAGVRGRSPREGLKNVARPSRGQPDRALQRGWTNGSSSSR